MIIGGSKKEVINNIKKNLKSNELNKKVEVDDPNLNTEEIDKCLKRFYANKKKKGYNLKNKTAQGILNNVAKDIYDSIEIKGLDNIKDMDLSKGAIITSNHFNPIDSYNIRKLVEQVLNKKLYIVIQDTNLAMKGTVGYLMNYLDVIPISSRPSYIVNTFIPELKKVLVKGDIVLIYPEEEMWFNYRLPRPCKRGAYHFAHELNVPLISCFVKIMDLDTDDNEEFKNVKYEVNVLKPLYPDLTLSTKKDSIKMADLDYQQKAKAYEIGYNQKLDYKYKKGDIAGWKGD